jgi:hypothetical protein
MVTEGPGTGESRAAPVDGMRGSLLVAALVLCSAL